MGDRAGLDRYFFFVNLWFRVGSVRSLSHRNLDSTYENGESELPMLFSSFFTTQTFIILLEVAFVYATKNKQTILAV